MNWEDKEVAVTGAAGFIGAHLCRTLVEKGAKVRGIDNFSVGAPENLKEINGLEIIKADITSKDSLKDALKDSEVVFHLAAVANPRTCKDNFDLAFKVNVDGTQNLLSLCEGAEKVLFFSSAAVYGNPEYVPIDEQHPLRGSDPYSITKIMGEQLCNMYHTDYGLPVTIIRNFNVYGEGQSTDYFIPTVVVQALKNGKVEIWNSKPSRDFIHVDDACRAYLSLAESTKSIGEAFNIGTGVETNVGSLAQTIARVLGDIPVIDLGKEVTGSPRLVCTNEKIRQVTGWQPKISLEEGIRRVVDYWRTRL